MEIPYISRISIRYKNPGLGLAFTLQSITKLHYPNPYPLLCNDTKLWGTCERENNQCFSEIGKTGPTTKETIDIIEGTSRSFCGLSQVYWRYSKTPRICFK